MQIEKIILQSCCNKLSIIFKLQNPISLNLLNILISKGFVELKHFTNVGIMYVENNDYILSGPIGSDKLQLKCKRGDCKKHSETVESILNGLQKF